MKAHGGPYVIRPAACDLENLPSQLVAQGAAVLSSCHPVPPRVIDADGKPMLKVGRLPSTDQRGPFERSEGAARVLGESRGQPWASTCAVERDRVHRSRLARARADAATAVERLDVALRCILVAPFGLQGFDRLAHRLR
jgi:hypothetical protein